MGYLNNKTNNFFCIQLHGRNPLILFNVLEFTEIVKIMASGKARMKKKVLDTSKLYELHVHEDPRKIHYIRL